MVMKWSKALVKLKVYYYWTLRLNATGSDFKASDLRADLCETTWDHFCAEKRAVEEDVEEESATLRCEEGELYDQMSNTCESLCPADAQRRLLSDCLRTESGGCGGNHHILVCMNR